MVARDIFGLTIDQTHPTLSTNKEYFFEGYCMFGLMFMASHVVSSLMNMEKMSQLAKLLYICIKAAIFMLFESFITPLLCGCWIDVCSLSLLVS